MTIVFLGQAILLFLGWGFVAFGTLWAAGAVYFDLPARRIFRAFSAIAWTTVALLVFFLPISFPNALALFATLLTLTAVWWRSVEPRTDREWKPEFAVLGYGIVNGDAVTIHNVRNFDYRTETDFAS